MNDIEDFSKKANTAVMSNNKYPCNCSNKCCVCGGHNSDNPKKNKKFNRIRYLFNPLTYSMYIL